MVQQSFFPLLFSAPSFSLLFLFWKVSILVCKKEEIKGEVKVVAVDGRLVGSGLVDAGGKIFLIYFIFLIVTLLTFVGLLFALLRFSYV